MDPVQDAYLPDLLFRLDDSGEDVARATPLGSWFSAGCHVELLAGLVVEVGCDGPVQDRKLRLVRHTELRALVGGLAGVLDFHHAGVAARLARIGVSADAFGALGAIVAQLGGRLDAGDRGGSPGYLGGCLGRGRGGQILGP